MRAAARALGRLGHGDDRRLVGLHVERPARQLRCRPPSPGSRPRSAARSGSRRCRCWAPTTCRPRASWPRRAGARLEPSANTSSDGAPRPWPLVRTISTLRSGTSTSFGCAAAARGAAGAVGQHQRRLAGIGRRRHPGIEPRLGEGDRRIEAEGRAQAVGRAVADQRQQRDDAEHEQPAQGDGILAIGARMRRADPETGERRGEARAVRLPDGGGARIVGVGGDRVLVGRGRPVRHAGNALDAAHGFLVRGERHAHGVQQRGDAGERRRRRAAT